MTQVGSVTFCTKERESSRGKPFLRIQGSMCQAFNVLLASIENTFPVTLLHADFSRGGMSMQSIQMFKSDGEHGMVEAEDYPGIDMVYPLYSCICLQSIWMYHV